MKTRLVLMAFVATLLTVWYAAPAMADDIQLSCPWCTTEGLLLISTDIHNRSGYTVYEFDLGTQTGVPNGASFTALTSNIVFAGEREEWAHDDCEDCGHDGQTPTIPEPSSLSMLGIGLVGLLGLARRRLVA